MFCKLLAGKQASKFDKSLYCMTFLFAYFRFDSTFFLFYFSSSSFVSYVSVDHCVNKEIVWVVQSCFKVFLFFFSFEYMHTYNKITLGSIQKNISCGYIWILACHRVIYTKNSSCKIHSLESLHVKKNFPFYDFIFKDNWKFTTTIKIINIR